MKFCNQLPNFKIISEVSKFDELVCNDVDYNLSNCTSNKYYSVGGSPNTKYFKKLQCFQMLMVLKAKWISCMNFYQVLLLISML